MLLQVFVLEHIPKVAKGLLEKSKKQVANSFAIFLGCMRALDAAKRDNHNTTLVTTYVNSFRTLDESGVLFFIWLCFQSFYIKFIYLKSNSTGGTIRPVKG